MAGVANSVNGPQAAPYLPLSGGTMTGAAALKGVINASSAAAGVVGEVISSVIASGSAISVTTATATNITSISLSAGDWDVYASAGLIFAGNQGTEGHSWISTTSATLADLSVRSSVTGVTNASVISLTSPSIQVNVNSNTTVYLSCYAVSAGAITGCGKIWARRRR